MEIIVWGLAIFGGYMLWKTILKPCLLGRYMPSVTERGLLAVYAAHYLMSIENGSTAEMANDEVKMLSMMNVEIPTDTILIAKNYIQHQYNGKQLPMITEARARGFNG